MSGRNSGAGRKNTYKLLLVAFSICSSRAVLAEEVHQLIILSGGLSASLWRSRRGQVAVVGVRLMMWCFRKLGMGGRGVRSVEIRELYGRAISGIRRRLEGRCRVLRCRGNSAACWWL